jgi:hypothetical protein
MRPAPPPRPHAEAAPAPPRSGRTPAQGRTRPRRTASRRSRIRSALTAKASSKPRPAHPPARGRGQVQHPRLGQAKVDMRGDQRRPPPARCARTTPANSATEAASSETVGSSSSQTGPPRHQKPRQPQPPLLPGRQFARHPVAPAARFIAAKRRIQPLPVDRGPEGRFSATVSVAFSPSAWAGIGGCLGRRPTVAPPAAAAARQRAQQRRLARSRSAPAGTSASPAPTRSDMPSSTGTPAPLDRQILRPTSSRPRFPDPRGLQTHAQAKGRASSPRLPADHFTPAAHTGKHRQRDPPPSDRSTL